MAMAVDVSPLEAIKEVKKTAKSARDVVSWAVDFALSAFSIKQYKETSAIAAYFDPDWYDVAYSENALQGVFSSYKGREEDIAPVKAAVREAWKAIDEASAKKQELARCNVLTAAKCVDDAVAMMSLVASANRYAALSAELLSASVAEDAEDLDWMGAGMLDAATPAFDISEEAKRDLAAASRPGTRFYKFYSALDAYRQPGSDGIAEYKFMQDFSAADFIPFLGLLYHVENSKAGVRQEPTKYHEAFNALLAGEDSGLSSMVRLKERFRQAKQLMLESLDYEREAAKQSIESLESEIERLEKDGVATLTTREDALGISESPRQRLLAFKERARFLASELARAERVFAARNRGHAAEAIALLQDVQTSAGKETDAAGVFESRLREDLLNQLDECENGVEDAALLAKCDAARQAGVGEAFRMLKEVEAAKSCSDDCPEKIREVAEETLDFLGRASRDVDVGLQTRTVNDALNDAKSLSGDEKSAARALLEKIGSARAAAVEKLRIEHEEEAFALAEKAGDAMAALKEQGLPAEEARLAAFRRLLDAGPEKAAGSYVEMKVFFAAVIAEAAKSPLSAVATVEYLPEPLPVCGSETKIVVRVTTFNPYRIPLEKAAARIAALPMAVLPNDAGAFYDNALVVPLGRLSPGESRIVDVPAEAMLIECAGQKVVVDFVSREAAKASASVRARSLARLDEGIAELRVSAIEASSQDGDAEISGGKVLLRISRPAMEWRDYSVDMALPSVLVKLRESIQANGNNGRISETFLLKCGEGEPVVGLAYPALVTSAESSAGKVDVSGKEAVLRAACGQVFTVTASFKDVEGAAAQAWEEAEALVNATADEVLRSRLGMAASLDAPARLAELKAIIEEAKRLLAEENAWKMELAELEKQALLANASAETMELARREYVAGNFEGAISILSKAVNDGKQKAGQERAAEEKLLADVEKRLSSAREKAGLLAWFGREVPKSLAEAEDLARAGKAADANSALSIAEKEIEAAGDGLRKSLAGDSGLEQHVKALRKAVAKSGTVNITIDTGFDEDYLEKEEQAVKEISAEVSRASKLAQKPGFNGLKEITERFQENPWERASTEARKLDGAIDYLRQKASSLIAEVKSLEAAKSDYSKQELVDAAEQAVKDGQHTRAIQYAAYAKAALQQSRPSSPLTGLMTVNNALLLLVPLIAGVAIWILRQPKKSEAGAIIEKMKRLG
jgi:hypothetical protein